MGTPLAFDPTCGPCCDPVETCPGHPAEEVGCRFDRDGRCETHGPDTNGYGCAVLRHVPDAEGAL